VVVYESVSGNSAQLARAVADVLAAHGSVELVAVGDATSSSVQGADLLVVGAPTHVWGMSWPWTRRIADRSRRAAQPAIGMRDWLRRLGPGHGHAAAAFDTEFESLLGLGSASRGIARRLRRRDYRLAARPARFFRRDNRRPALPGRTCSGPEVSRRTRGVDLDVSDNRDQRILTHPDQTIERPISSSNS
jgi:Flavodoxin domain